MNIGNIFRKYGTLIGLIFIFISFSVVRPHIFPVPRNLINIIQQISLLAIIGTGATIVMVITEFDLSIAAVASFGGVFTAQLMVKGMGVVPAITVVLLLSFLLGLLNGFLVAKLKIKSFIATLATMTIITGLTFWYSEGTIIFSGIPEKFLIIGQQNIGPFPIPIFVMFGILIIFYLLLTQTVFGRNLYAIGGNIEASLYSGVRVVSNKIIAFGLSSLLGSLTGIILASRLGSAHPTAGGGFLLTSYAAVFLGMTLFKDGEPNIIGTFIGVLIIGVLANGLTILNVQSYFQDMLTGAIIILALLFKGVARE